VRQGPDTRRGRANAADSNSYLDAPRAAAALAAGIQASAAEAQHANA
jgi:hypothetical protein